MRYSKITTDDRTPALAVLDAKATRCIVLLGNTAKMYKSLRNITATDDSLVYQGKVNPERVNSGIYPVNLLKSLRAAILRLQIGSNLTYTQAIKEMNHLDESLSSARSFDTVTGMFDEEGLLIGRPGGFKVTIHDENGKFKRGFYLDSYFVVDTGIGKAFASLQCDLVRGSIKTTPVLEDVEIIGDRIRRPFQFSSNHLGASIVSQSFANVQVQFSADCSVVSDEIYASTSDVHGIVCYKLSNMLFKREWQIVGTESFSSSVKAQKRGMELALRAATDGRVTESMAVASGFYLKAASVLASRSIVKTSTALDEGTSLLAKLQSLNTYYSQNKIETSEELGEIIGTLTRVATGCSRTQVTEFTTKFLDRLKNAYLLRYMSGDANEILQGEKVVFTYNSSHSKSFIRKVSQALTKDAAPLKELIATKKASQTNAVQNALALKRGVEDAIGQAEATSAQYRKALLSFNEQELSAQLLLCQQRVEQAESRIADAQTIAALASAGARVLAEQLAKFLALPVISGVWGGSLGTIGDLVNIQYATGNRQGVAAWKRDLSAVPFMGVKSVEIEYSCQGNVQAQRGDSPLTVCVYGGCNPDKGDYQKTKVLEMVTTTLQNKQYQGEPIILISPEIVANLGMSTAYPVRRHEVKFLSKYTIDRDCKKITVWDNNYAYPVGLTLTQFKTFVIAVINDIINKPAFKLAGVGAAALEDATSLLKQCQLERAEVVSQSIRRERLMELYSESLRRVRYFTLLGEIGDVGRSNRTIAYKETTLTESEYVNDALSNIYSSLSIVDTVALSSDKSAAEIWSNSQLEVKYGENSLSVSDGVELTLKSGLYDFTFKPKLTKTSLTLTPVKVTPSYEAGEFQVVIGGRVLNLTQMIRMTSSKVNVDEDADVYADALSLFSRDDISKLVNSLPLTEREKDYLNSLTLKEEEMDFVNASKLLAFVALLDEQEMQISAVTAMGESKAIAELTSPTNFALGLALTERFM